MGEALIVRRGGGGSPLPMELVDKASAMLNTSTNTAAASIGVPETGTYLCIAFGANSTNTLQQTDHGASGGMVVIRNGEIVQQDLRYFTFAGEFGVTGEAELADGILTVSVYVPPSWTTTGKIYKGLGLLLFRMGATSSAAAETITFTVNSAKFTAEAGMTWDEFVGSKYNTATGSGDADGRWFKVDGDDHVNYVAWFNDPDDRNEDGDLSPYYSWILGGEEGVYQTANMTIEDGGKYVTED